MNLDIYQQVLERIRSLSNAQSYNEALRLVEETLALGILSSEIFLLRGKLIQLADSSIDVSLLNVETAFQSLEMANRLAPNYVEPIIELAHLKYAAFINRSEEALSDFIQAELKALSGLEDALIGQAKCYKQLGEISKAHLILQRLKNLSPDDESYKILQLEMEEDL